MTIDVTFAKFPSRYSRFIQRNRSAVIRAVEDRLLQIGVEPSIIGVNGVPGFDSDGFVRYPNPQGGGTIRPDHPNVLAGRWNAGINIDEPIFMPDFDSLRGVLIHDFDAAREYQYQWNHSMTRSRLDAVAAHEWTEFYAIEPSDWDRHLHGVWNPHTHAIRYAPESNLEITRQAVRLLELYRQALGFS